MQYQKCPAVACQKELPSAIQAMQHIIDCTALSESERMECLRRHYHSIVFARWSKMTETDEPIQKMAQQATQLSDSGLTILRPCKPFTSEAGEAVACIEIRKKLLDLAESERAHHGPIDEEMPPISGNQTVSYRLGYEQLLTALSTAGDAGIMMIRSLLGGVQFLKERTGAASFDVGEFFLLDTPPGADPQILHTDAGIDAWGMLLYLQPTTGRQTLFYVPDSHIKGCSFSERQALNMVAYTDTNHLDVNDKLRRLHKQYQTVSAVAIRDRAAGRPAFNIHGRTDSEQCHHAPSVTLGDILITDLTLKHGGSVSASGEPMVVLPGRDTEAIDYRRLVLFGRFCASTDVYEIQLRSTNCFMERTFVSYGLPWKCAGLKLTESGAIDSLQQCLASGCKRRGQAKLSPAIDDDGNDITSRSHFWSQKVNLC